MSCEAILRRILAIDTRATITSVPALRHHVLRVWIVAVAISLAVDVGLTSALNPTDLHLAFIRGFLMPTLIAVPMAVRSGLSLLNAARVSDTLRDLVRRDHQTGLLHHNAFIEEASQALVKQEARVLLIGDIDRFKSINDSCGHLIGDHVILAVGEVVRDLFGRNAITGRIGGEEFAVLMLLPFADRIAAHHAALAFAQEWRKRIEQLHVGGVPFPISISIGVARSSVGETLDSLYARADRALYVAKTSGRNRVCADEHELAPPDGPWPDESATEVAWVEDPESAAPGPEGLRNLAKAADIVPDAPEAPTAATRLRTATRH